MILMSELTLKQKRRTDLAMLGQHRELKLAGEESLSSAYLLSL